MILFAYAVAALIALAGYKAKALTWDGALAACLVGGTIFGFGGLGWAVLLVAFFASSSALSLIGAHEERKRRAAETFDKGGRRDAAQVIANGGVAALAALLSQALGPGALPVMFGAFVGALAEAAADTWATEVGTLSRRRPRLITTGRPVEAGTSGGITALGSGAGMLGATAIGLLAALVRAIEGGPFSLLVLAQVTGLSVTAGMVGMLVDSLLGATVQAQYHCPACNKPTESRVHRCGTTTRLVQGTRWANNDLVNLAGTLAGATVGAALAVIIPI